MAQPRFTRRPLASRMMRLPSGKIDVVHLGLDLLPGVALQGGDVDLAVEVADVAHDGLVLHLRHVVMGDHAAVAGGGDEDVGLVAGVVHGHHPVAFHGRLQGADGVDLGDPHLGRQGLQGLGAALAHVAVAAHHRHLAGDHHVRGPLDAVHQGLAAAVQIVELGFGHRVVDVDGREPQLAPLGHLVEPVHSGGGLLGDAPDGRQLADTSRRPGQPAADGAEQGHFLLAARMVQDGGVVLGPGAQVHQQGGVAPVVKDQVGGAFLGS